ncbi:hypothetical protein B9Z31_03470 [Limnohabitans sp. G3-2]|nr:hypothetical protein B9Z31_03470 [Limnohabitans sp. G3-2]
MRSRPFAHPASCVALIVSAWLVLALFSPAQAQTQTQTQTQAGGHPLTAQFSRPEVAALKGVVPTPPVRLRVWGFEVYDARLWTPVGFRYGQAVQFPFALELQYLRKLEGAAIASRSIDEMRRVGSLSEAQVQNWQSAMRDLFPNVSAGERITGVNLPGIGAEFWVNGQRAGAIQDVAFARLFFGIWLDERTSEPQMRAQLLQGLQP